METKTVPGSISSTQRTTVTDEDAIRDVRAYIYLHPALGRSPTPSGHRPQTASPETLEWSSWSWIDRICSALSASFSIVPLLVRSSSQTLVTLISIAEGGCSPELNVKRRTSELREGGGEVVIEFGGRAGTNLLRFDRALDRGC